MKNRPVKIQESLISPAKREAFEAALVLLERAADRRAAIRAAAPAEFQFQATVPLIRPEALLALKNGLEAQAKVSHIRVHPSWRKALIARQPAGVVASLGSESSKNKGILTSIAHDSAHVLTFERLVGDSDPVNDDPAVVRLFKGEDRRAWLERIVWAGRLKRALANSQEQSPLKAFFNDLPETWPSLASGTLARFFGGMPKRVRSDGHLGLTTIGSLAGRIEPRRRQWILQHFPMDLGPLLATWLRIGKPPWPDEQIAVEEWIAGQALLLAEGLTEPAADEVIESPNAAQIKSDTAPPPLTSHEEPQDSVELVELIAGDSALFDLDLPDFDEQDSGEDSSFRLGDLNL